MKHKSEKETTQTAKQTTPNNAEKGKALTTYQKWRRIMYIQQIHRRIQVQDTSELHIIHTTRNEGGKEQKKQDIQRNTKKTTQHARKRIQARPKQTEQQDRDIEQRRKYNHIKEAYRQRNKRTSPKCNSVGKLRN